MIKKLMDGALKIGVILNIEKAEKYIKYLDMLCDKNSVVNLTAIRDKEEIIEKHFIDSLIVSKYIPLNAKTATWGANKQFNMKILKIIGLIANIIQLFVN